MGAWNKRTSNAALEKKKIIRVFLGEKMKKKPQQTQHKTKLKKEQPSNFRYAVLIKVEVSFMYALHSRLDTVVAVPEILMRC